MVIPDQILTVDQHRQLRVVVQVPRLMQQHPHQEVQEVSNQKMRDHDLQLPMPVAVHQLAPALKNLPVHPQPDQTTNQDLTDPEVHLHIPHGQDLALDLEVQLLPGVVDRENLLHIRLIENQKLLVLQLQMHLDLLLAHHKVTSLLLRRVEGLGVQRVEGLT